MIALDVRNKVVEIHFVSASGRHEGGSVCNLAGVHDAVSDLKETARKKPFYPR